MKLLYIPNSSSKSILVYLLATKFATLDVDMGSQKDNTSHDSATESKLHFTEVCLTQCRKVCLI